MPGRSISGYVDEAVASRVAAIARAEDRAPANIVGQAISHYVSLPEFTRRALRSIETRGKPEEQKWALEQVARAVLRADMEITERRIAAQIGPDAQKASTEEELEAATRAVMKRLKKK